MTGLARFVQIYTPADIVHAYAEITRIHEELVSEYSQMKNKLSNCTKERHFEDEKIRNRSHESIVATCLIYATSFYSLIDSWGNCISSMCINKCIYI